MRRGSILFCLALLIVSKQGLGQDKTAYWLDTLTADGRFIKIYTTPDNDWKNLFAEWGLPGLRNKIDLGKFEKGYLIGETSFELSWTTADSFVLKKGCGTSCTYVLVFNNSREMPYWIPTDVTPEMNNANFFVQDKRHIVHFSNDQYLQLVVEDIDTRKKFKVKLPDEWARGSGTFFHIVDSLTIENSVLSVYQKNDKGETIRQLTKKIELN